MSVTDGGTVFTLTSDPKSFLPPLFQILYTRCPIKCSVTQDLRTAMGTSQSSLGALQIMVGVLNICLGIIPMSYGAGTWWYIYVSFFSLWMGPVFMIFGIWCIVSDKYPSPCLIIISLILNLSGVGFAIAAIVLCSINIAIIPYSLVDECLPRGDNFWRTDYLTNMTSYEKDYYEQCMEGKAMILLFLRGINGVLLLLCVLELCLVLSSSVLVMKALRSSNESEERSLDDTEPYKPLLEEVLPANSSA
ncbi:transmembrane protein 176B-like [Dunckerocampus dactyliophorus]|uniref:transmembrane protein 176B-like n=1 Tax=Dunckerocampus dactyliophorus TaxID=161453 RepID=UPI002406160F|nr:transmembrane protein 176B-like [Dunckerocampus dactyliophorus]